MRLRLSIECTVTSDIHAELMTGALTFGLASALFRHQYAIYLAQPCAFLQTG